MKLNYLFVENFRSFYGENFLNFSTDSEKNTTIIFAPNGFGKTNLLNAILWCFHNKFSPSFKDPSNLLNWEAARKGRKTYHVEVGFSADGSEWRIRRSGGGVSGFKLWKIEDGNHREITSGQESFINTILPVDMAGYFISDGEGGDLQVNNQALLPVGRSIQDILGFGVAEKAIEDIKSFRSDFAKQLARLDNSGNIGPLVEKIDGLKGRIERARTFAKESKEVRERYEAELKEVDSDLKNIDVDSIKRLTRDRDKAQNLLTREKKQLSKLLRDRISLLRDYAWVAFANKLEGEGLEFIDEAEYRGRLPAPFNQQLVTDILEEAKCICGADVAEGSDAFDRIKSLLKQASNPELENRVHRARSTLIWYKERIPRALSALKRNLEERSTSEQEIQRLESELEDISISIGRIDSSNISTLENKRRDLASKLSDTSFKLGRNESELERYAKELDAAEGELSRLNSLSPQVQRLREKIALLDDVQALINDELEATREQIADNLKDKIDQFLDRYLQFDYRIRITPDLKIGLQTREGYAVPTSGGESAILSFIYISSLVSIAREYSGYVSKILIPGSLAPLIYDAPFSSLSPTYALNVARQLPKLVDQLIILMYQDEGKDVAGELLKEGRLGKVCYLDAHIANPSGDKDIEFIKVDDRKIQVTHYESSSDRVEIKEAASYVD